MKWVTALTSVAALATSSWAKEVTDCSCGFVDETHHQVWTDALIVYFNETSEITDDFNILEFHHKKEYGWNSLYRQGALPANARVGDNATEGLELWINQSNGQHYVAGSGIEAKRQDMHFGTFRTSMRGPPKYSG